MAILILGLVIFLGLHSIRIVSESGREKAIARFGEGPWKGIYSLVSAIGFVLIVWGFARARHDAPQLWTPFPGARHITMLLDARRAHSARELSLQAQPHHGCGPSSDAVGGLAMERWASRRQRLGCGPCAVRRLPRLVGRGSRKLVRPRPAQRRRLSGARDPRHRRRGRRRPRPLRACCSAACTSGCSASRRSRDRRAGRAGAAFLDGPRGENIASSCFQAHIGTFKTRVTDAPGRQAD